MNIREALVKQTEPESQSKKPNLSLSHSTLFHAHSILDEISPRRGLDDAIRMPVFGFFNVGSSEPGEPVNVLLAGLQDRDRTLFSKNLVFDSEKKARIGLEFQSFSLESNRTVNVFDASILSRGGMHRGKAFQATLFFGSPDEVKITLIDLERRGIVNKQSQFFSITYFESLKESKIQIVQQSELLKIKSKNISLGNEMAKILGVALFSKIDESMENQKSSTLKKGLSKASV